jgi:hypothetical protein
MNIPNLKINNENNKNYLNFNVYKQIGFLILITVIIMKT